MNIATTIFAASLAAMNVNGQCKDGICPADAVQSKLTAAEAVPMCAIAPVKQANRLKSLEGKTIALVGGSFMASVTHPELKRLILKEYPSANVILLSEIGSAGPYPRPGVVRREKDEFQRRLKEMHVDAVVSGNGGCGLCTPKETGSCIAAEMLGIPSVMIAGPGFVTQAKSAARSAGIASLRVAEYPGSFTAHTHDELLDNTRKILWPQIKKALTTPFAEDDVYRPNGTFVSDGLPTVTLSDDAIREFLLFTDRAADDSIGAIPPAMRDVKVRHVAALGVMSGCPAEFMPLLIAFTEAMKDGNFRRTLSSTHAWTPYCWLNGPVPRQLGFDCGQGEISGQKNMLLGRFMNLALLNFGGYRVKENRMGTFGYLTPWTLVENESAAVKAGWKPYHLQQGYNPNDSTLTAASAINWGNNLVPATSDAERIKDMIAWDAVEKQQMAVGSGMPCTCRTFLITPDVARDLAAKYKSKADLEKALVDTARNPLGSRVFANYWGNPGSSQEKHTLYQHSARIARNERAEMTAAPPWLAWTGLSTMETVPAMEFGKSAFIVTGDESRNKEMCIPGGETVTIKVELPGNWDRLMADRGYAPLSSFFLVDGGKGSSPSPNADALTPDRRPRMQRRRFQPQGAPFRPRGGSYRPRGERFQPQDGSFQPRDAPDGANMQRRRRRRRQSERQ